jgi:radical SAM-linked protein
VDTIGPRQRLRITFSRGEAVKYIAHLDLVRLWERIVRRARVPVSYSATELARPKLSLAAPLAVGLTSEGELLDLFLDARLPLVPLAKRLALECPAGIVINQIVEVSLGLPSLQSLVRFSEYRTSVDSDMSMSDIERRVAQLLAAPSLPRERLREKELRRYDLRPLIDSLWVTGQTSDGQWLGMILQTDEQATGRPDEVLAALGLGEPAHSIHRVKLMLAPPQPAAPTKAFAPSRRRT